MVKNLISFFSPIANSALKSTRYKIYQVWDLKTFKRPLNPRVFEFKHELR